jgi:ABC-2 type transport system ATP-binding protein
MNGLTSRNGDASALPSVFAARGVTKRFGKRRVLDGLDLELAPGCVTALLGENGAGKSTLIKLALGVLKADAGSLVVAGCDPLRQSKRLRERIGFVPDVPDAYPWMTVRDLFRYLAPHWPSWDARLAASLVESLRIPADTPFKAMSRGEGMKAMLAAALAPRPGLLLLDEPFAGLDPLVREEVLRSVIGELRDGERTVLVATHDLDVVARIADRVAILAGGRIARHGTLSEVLGEKSGSGSAGGDGAANGESSLLDDGAGVGAATFKLRDALAATR